MRDAARIATSRRSSTSPDEMLGVKIERSSVFAKKAKTSRHRPRQEVDLPFALPYAVVGTKGFGVRIDQNVLRIAPDHAQKHFVNADDRRTNRR